MKKCNWCNSTFDDDLNICPHCKAEYNKFDKELKTNHAEIYLKNHANDPKWRREQRPLVIKCPYCGSDKTKRIKNIEKVTNIALFGIFGNRRKRQWHCNNCKSDF